MSLSLGMSDNEFAVKLAATQAAVIGHCTGPRVLPLVYELFSFNTQQYYYCSLLLLLLLLLLLTHLKASSTVAQNLLITIIIHCVDDAKIEQEAAWLLSQRKNFVIIINGEITVTLSPKMVQSNGTISDKGKGKGKCIYIAHFL